MNLILCRNSFSLAHSPERWLDRRVGVSPSPKRLLHQPPILLPRERLAELALERMKSEKAFRLALQRKWSASIFYTKIQFSYVTMI
jgi:hypothetical protein